MQLKLIYNLKIITINLNGVQEIINRGNLPIQTI